jgi:ankyrin repeat protein
LSILHETTDLVKYFVEHGSDINKADNRGETPVHLASKLYHIEVLRYLIGDQRADINVRRYTDFWTPLHCAAFWDRRECCEYLIENGGDTRAKDKDGRMPMELASEKHLIEYMKNVTARRGRRSVEHSTLIAHPNRISCEILNSHLRIGSPVYVSRDARPLGQDTSFNFPFQFQNFLILSSAVLFRNSRTDSRNVYLEKLFLKKEMDLAGEVAVNAPGNFETF